MPAKKATSKGKRYTDAEKAEILNFIERQGRGGATAASKKFGVSPLTISSWRKSSGGTSARTKSTAAIDKDEVLRQLAKKGFKVVRMVNALTGELVEEKIDPKIEKLGLDFGGLKGKAADSVTYVTQTSGQVLVMVTLDRLLAITGTKP